MKWLINAVRSTARVGSWTSSAIGGASMAAVLSLCTGDLSFDQVGEGISWIRERWILFPSLLGAFFTCQLLYHGVPAARAERQRRLEERKARQERAELEHWAKMRDMVNEAVAQSMNSSPRPTANRVIITGEINPRDVQYDGTRKS